MTDAVDTFIVTIKTDLLEVEECLEVAGYL